MSWQWSNWSHTSLGIATIYCRTSHTQFYRQRDLRLDIRKITTPLQILFSALFAQRNDVQGYALQEPSDWVLAFHLLQVLCLSLNVNVNWHLKYECLSLNHKQVKFRIVSFEIWSLNWLPTSIYIWSLQSGCEQCLKWKVESYKAKGRANLVLEKFDGAEPEETLTASQLKKTLI